MVAAWLAGWLLHRSASICSEAHFDLVAESCGVTVTQEGHMLSSGRGGGSRGSATDSSSQHKRGRDGNAEGKDDVEGDGGSGNAGADLRANNKKGKAEAPAVLTALVAEHKDGGDTKAMAMAMAASVVACEFLPGATPFTVVLVHDSLAYAAEVPASCSEQHAFERAADLLRLVFNSLVPGGHVRELSQCSCFAFVATAVV